MKDKGVSKDKFITFSLFAIFVSAFLLLFFFIPSNPTGYFTKEGTGPYTYTCSNCSDCNEAINDSSTGDTIYLNQPISGAETCINITDKTGIIFDCQGNSIQGSSTGALLINSNSSQIKNCNFTGFAYGVNVVYSEETVLTNIEADNNAVGVFYLYGFNNTITHSYIKRNSDYGLYLYSSANNLIYNNLLNNTVNAYIYQGESYISFFNSTKISSANIIGKSYTGGNFWATPSGTGFSENCTADADSDFICDASKSIDNSYDYLPLIYNITSWTCTENWTCTNWTVCNASGNRTRTCTDTNSCGTNISKPALVSSCTLCTENWTCGTWSSCVNNNQTRTCTDLNSCGTTATKPALSQICTSANTTAVTNTPANNTGVSGTEGIGTNVTSSITTATPSSPAVINIDDSQIYLTKIILNVLDSIQSASVTVTKVNVLEDSNLAAGLPSGQFYQGFKIETSGVTSSNIANVTIEFKVNKLWLTGKNGTSSGIKLYRRPDLSSQWNRLSTVLTSQDSDYYYFTSFSSGFSTFAVLFNPSSSESGSGLSGALIFVYVVLGVGLITAIIVTFVLIGKINNKNESSEKKPVD